MPWAGARGQILVSSLRVGSRGYARVAVALRKQPMGLQKQGRTPRWEMLFGVQGTPAPSRAILVLYERRSCPNPGP